MKITPILLAACAAVTSAWSTSIDIQWKEDSLSAFDVVISGTGFNWNDTITSPSGLWEFNGGHWGGVGEEAFINLLENWADMIFLPGRDPNPMYNRFSSTHYSYLTAEQLALPIDMGMKWGEFSGLSGWGESYGFHNPLVITSQPSLFDLSTWTWLSEYKGSGKKLHVPEGGSAWLLMAFASGILLIFRPKCA